MKRVVSLFLLSGVVSALFAFGTVVLLRLIADEFYGGFISPGAGMVPIALSTAPGYGLVLHSARWTQSRYRYPKVAAMR